MSKQYDIFDGKAYLFTVSTKEDPFETLAQERFKRRNPRLHLEELDTDTKQRTIVVTPGSVEPEPDEDYDFEDWEEYGQSA